eukprot:TRINITY_DN4141_c0_g1_i1.p1 TRINITY_DN4141_c0_g1~~TRINITY_DN4141_c0_g1_i1.p1  ORF type:complete len:2424 (+),score=636.40 TRINITY_DN4141_c0_g1_i1:380-7273(+)
MKQSSKAWWTDAIDELEKAEDLVKQLRVPEYESNPDVITYLSNFDSDAKALRETFADKMAEDELDDVIRDIKGIIQTATKYINEGNPSWWDDAINELEKGQEFRQQLVKFPNIPLAVKQLQEFDSAAADIKNQFHTKKAEREMEDLERDLNSKISTAKRHMTQGSPAWWSDALVELERAMDIRSDIVNSVYGELPFALRILREFDEAAAQIKLDYNTKTRIRECEDLSGDIRGKLNSAEGKMSKGDPAWWTEAMEELEEASAFGEKLKSLFSDLPQCQEAIGNLNFKSFEMKELFTTKRRDRDISDKTRDIKDALNEAERHMNHGDPAWWSDALQKVEEADEMVAKLNEKFGDSPSARSTILDSKIRSSAVRTLYNEKSLAREVSDQSRDVRMKLDEAESKMQKAPPVSWAEEAMEAVEEAASLAAKLSGPRYHDSEEARQTVANFEERRTVLKESYFDKVQGSIIRDIEQDLSLHMGNAERKIAGSSRQWWDEALDDLELATTVMMKLPRIPKTEETIAKHIARSADMRAEYNEKVRADDLSDLCRDLSSVMRTAADKMAKCPPVEWATEAMEEAEKAENIVKEILAPRFDALPKAKEALDNYNKELIALKDEFHSKVLEKEISDAKQDMQSAWGEAERKFNQNSRQWWDEAMEELEKVEAIISKTMSNSSLSRSKEIASVVSEYRNKGRTMRDEYTSKVVADEAKDRIRDVRHHLSAAEDKLKKGHAQFAEEAMADLEKATEELSHCRDSKFAGQSAIAELFEEYSKRSKEIRKEFTEQVTEGQARDKLQEVKSELSTAEMKFKQGPPSSWWDEAMEHLQNAEELNTKLKADAMLGQVDSVVEFQADLMQRAAGLRTGYSINMLKDNLKDALREVRDLLSAAEASFAKGPNRFWLDQAMEELSKAKDAMDTKLVKEVRFADEADYLEFKSDFETRSVSLSDKYREATLLADVEDVINKIQSKLSESKRCLEHQLYDESLQSLQEAEASSVTAASNTRIAGHPKLSEYLTTFYSDLKTLRDEFNEKTLNQTVSRLVYDLSSQLRTATDSFKKGPPTSWWDQGIEELDVLSEMIATNLSKCPPEVKSHNEVKEFLIKYEEEKEKMKKQYRENVSKAEYDKIVYQIKEKLSEAEFLMKRGPPVSYFDDAMEKLSDAQNINCKLCSDSRFRGEELNAFEQLFKEKVEDLQKAYNTNTLQESASDACRELRRFSSEAEHKMNQGPPRSYYDEALAIIQEGKDFANDLRACEVLANAADVSAALSSFDAQMTQLEKRYNELTVQDDVASHISSSKSHLQVAQSLFKKISPVTWLEEGLIEMFKAVDEAEVLKSDLYKDISDATSYLSELNTIVATLKEEYNNAVLADKLNAIKDECNRKLQQAADYMERGILDSALGCLEVGNRDLKGMKENRIFLGNTTAEEFIKEWSSKASDLKKQLAVKLHRDEARILLENGNRSLSDFSSAASESLKRAALLSAQRTVDSLLKKPLLIELEEVASFLKQKKDADASYATDFLQQEVAPITQAISVLIDSAESSSVRGAKKEARSLLEKATTLSFGNKKGPIPLNLTTDMMMSIPTVKNVMDRLVLKSRQWFKCNIVEEASEGGGASEEAGPVDPDQMTIQQFCTSEYKPPAEVPQLEQIPVSADIKACLLKYLRKFNESAETINNEARLAVKNANKIPWNTASNPKKWDYTAMSIDYSRYPIETIDRMCEYMTTSGPDRTISLMQQVAPEDPTVVGLVENFNEFRTQLQNYRTFWKRMEKFCRTYNTLSRLTKEGETADLQTTLKCESKSRAIIDELSSTHSTGSFPLKDRYLERLEKNHIEAHKRHSILYVTTFCKKHGEGGASSCLKQLQNFPRAYAEATRRYDEMTETHTQRQYPKERSEIEKRCRYNSFTPTAPAREDEDPDLWKAPYTVIKSGPEALSGFPSRPSAQLQASTQKIVDHNKSRHNKVVFARQNIDAACCKDSIFASEFQFGEQIHARAFWDTPICNYPVALDSENKPLYTLEKSKNHYAEFVLIAYINGEKVDRPLQPEGDIGNFTSRDEANFWGSQATVKIWAQKPDYILSNDDWAQSTQRINRKLITTYGPGKHTVKLEVCYRIIQKDKNYTMQTPNIPQFNTPLSHPIASGEYTVEVPSNPQSYSVFKPHTAKISPSAADELADLIKTGLSNHRMWGKAGKAEIPIHVCVKSDWRVVDTASVVVKNGGKITIYEEPSQYGVDCEVLFYRTPSRGWSNEEIVVFDLTAAAAEHRGETRGDPPTKTFPPKDFFVGSCFTAEPTLIPLDILKDLPRPSSNFDY